MEYRGRRMNKNFPDFFWIFFHDYEIMEKYASLITRGRLRINRTRIDHTRKAEFDYCNFNVVFESRYRTLPYRITLFKDSKKKLHFADVLGLHINFIDLIVITVLTVKLNTILK